MNDLNSFFAAPYCRLVYSSSPRKYPSYKLVYLSGWLHRKRDHGNLLFIDLRDHYGMTQCVIENKNNFFPILEKTKPESVLKISGKVVKRSSDTENLELVTGKIFNAGYENQTVNHLASLVKKVIGPDVKIKYLKSDDNRSYHISSKKIKDVLGFETKKTIEDAIKDLKNAFDAKKLEDTLTNEKYFNIKRMNNLKLK